MMKRMLFILPLLSCLGLTAAHANWEYASEYVGGGWYTEDGSRFVLSIRGGASLGMGKIKNEVGELSASYYVYDPNNEGAALSSYEIVPETNLRVACGGAICDGYVYAGYGNVGDLPAKENYRKLAFAAGASVGWVMPERSNWRLELGWDRITEAEYNVSPLYDGNITLYGGVLDGKTVNVQSGAVHSTVTTDVISAMAFYDFFDGMRKPLHTIIPYIGLGAGYANSVTELQLIDKYGDLSTDAELRQDYSENSEDRVLRFYKSKKSTSNIAGVLALGMSYGMNEKMFLDFGARLMYVPQIKWALASADDSRHRDWFSAKNMIYANFMLGLRFEF